MNKKKYLVIGDYVISRTDADIHFISAEKLVELYKVLIEECVLVASARNIEKCHIDLARTGEVLILKPRFDENYTIEAVMNDLLKR